MIKPPSNLRSFEALLDVMKALRGPEGCPWDKEQTHKTLTPYAIEEAHELAEAIESGTKADMVSELGDVLLQVVLHAEIGRQAGDFDILDVIETLNAKMVRRHPHVFADVAVGGTDDVLANWAAIKKAEKNATGSAGADTETSAPRERFDIPDNLPALTRSAKIGSKTKAHRFDWSTPDEVLVKLDEEVGELKEAMTEGDSAHIEHELGDVLFSVAQLSRHLKIEPEQSLRIANARFEKRFFKMRSMIAAAGLDADRLPSSELEEFWQKAKRELS